jgi:hypothetical protein
VATSATDDEAGQAILQQWVDEFDLSHIPVLAVGDEAVFDAWDLDDTCPSYWVLDGDRTVRTADAGSVDWDEVGELVTGSSTP